MKKFVSSLALLVVLGTGTLVGYQWWRTKNTSPVQRGWLVAAQQGCFTCHGPGGTHGGANPGYGPGDTPDWDGGTIMMYAQTRDEIYEWIRDGMPARIRNNPTSMADREHALIRMPAWRGKVSGGDLDDLVAFVEAVSRFKKPPRDSQAAKGLEVGDKFGCFNCHGPMGRGSSPNARSFKGYIPSWDGADFSELVANDQELRDWILDGGTKRISEHPVGRWFIARQLIKMPAYRHQASDDEVQAVIAYIRWLREQPDPGAEKK